MKTLKKMMAGLMVCMMALSLVAVMPTKESKAYGSGNFSIAVDGVVYSCFSDPEAEGYGTAYVYGFDKEVAATLEAVSIKSEVTDENGKTYKVTAVGGTIEDEDSTDMCTKLTKIVIPDSVTYIGTLLRGCKELRSVEIPNTVTEIEGQAFNGCARLTDITLPENPGFTRIESLTFGDCVSLNDITIPKNVTYIAGFDGKELSAFSEQAPINMYGYIDSVAEDYADFHKNVTFVPVNGISCDLFRVKFPDSWVGKYVAVPFEDGNGISVSAKKAYLENENGGHLFSVCVENYGWYDDIFPSWHLIKKQGSMNYIYAEPTDVQMDAPEYGFTEYGYSADAIAEYDELIKNSIGPDNVDIRLLAKTPKASAVNKIKKSGSKAKVTVKKVSGVSGYEIQYDTNAKFKYATADGKKGTTKTTTFTTKALKKGKTWFFRTRSYKVVGSMKVYSNWSKVKKLKIK